MTRKEAETPHGTTSHFVATPQSGIVQVPPAPPHGTTSHVVVTPQSDISGIVEVPPASPVPGSFTPLLSPIPSAIAPPSVGPSTSAKVQNIKRLVLVDGSFLLSRSDQRTQIVRSMAQTIEKMRLTDQSIDQDPFTLIMVIKADTRNDLQNLSTFLSKFGNSYEIVAIASAPRRGRIDESSPAKEIDDAYLTLLATGKFAIRNIFYSSITGKQIQVYSHPHQDVGGEATVLSVDSKVFKEKRDIAKIIDAVVALEGKEITVTNYRYRDGTLSTTEESKNILWSSLLRDHL